MTDRPAGLPDLRCPGMPDIPDSAYCTHCWRPVYSGWTLAEPHSGGCTMAYPGGKPCRRPPEVTPNG